MMMRQILRSRLLIISRYWGAALTVFLLNWWASPAHAGIIISPSIAIESNLALQSVIVNSEVGLLQPFLRLTRNDTLLYSSITTPSGWGGTLSGTYSGGQILIVYTGSITGDPDVSVTSSGEVSLGAYTSNWRGREDISRGIRGETNFGVTLNGDLEVGVSIPVADIISAEFSATKEVEEHAFVLRSGVAAGHLEIGPVNFTLADAALGYRIFQDSRTSVSFWEASAFWFFNTGERIVDGGEHGDPELGLPVQNSTIIRVSIVSEPDTLSLILLTMSVLLMVALLKRMQSYSNVVNRLKENLVRRPTDNPILRLQARV